VRKQQVSYSTTHEYIRPRSTYIVEHGGRAEAAARIKYKFLPAEAEVVKRRKKLAISS